MIKIIKPITILMILINSFEQNIIYHFEKIRIHLLYNLNLLRNKRSLIMKMLFTILFIVTETTIVLSQTPEKMSYQAIIRNNNNSLITNKNISLQISIIKDSETGIPVYIETHKSTTNANGLVTLIIGTGEVILGSFTNIDWSSGIYYMKTETDIEGGVNYTITGTCEILSVPYALFVNKTGSINETDPVFIKSTAATISETDISYWNQKLDTEVDNSVTNELQIISISNDTIYLTNGGFAVLPTEFDGDYNSLTNIPINVSSFINDVGYLTYEKDSSVLNELQFLSISNDTILLTNGGFIKLPPGYDGNWTNIIGKPNFATVATSGSYSDLSNKPTIPTMTSQLINNSGFLTFEKDSSVTNELQFLSIHNDTIFLTNGGFVKLPFESDPIFNTSIAAQITTTDTAKWNNKQNLLISGIGINITGNKISATGIGTGVDSNSFYLGKDTLGGIVFYIYLGEDGQQHGLIVSKSVTALKWQNSRNITSASRSWDGVYNTNIITDSPAKNWVQGLGANWYLPSVNELFILWTNRFHVNKAFNNAGITLLFSINSNYYYWSSTEYDYTYALAIEFYNGYPTQMHKEGVCAVLAIKAF